MRNIADLLKDPTPGSAVEIMTETGKRTFRLLAVYGKEHSLPRTYFLLAPDSPVAQAEVYCIGFAPDGDIYVAREDDESIIRKIFTLYNSCRNKHNR